MFNPFEFQFITTFLGIEGNMAKLNIQKGSQIEEAMLPLSLLPKSIKPGNEFILKIQAPETAKTGEYESLRKLLQELIT